jgi:hypothetical protein
MKMRSRIEESANYKSVFINGKTLRFAIDNSKPITELRWPEFYDLGINTRCYAKCPMCYTSATNKGVNYKNVVEKVYKFFGNMTLNQRPYQIAIGASGEATLHPDFVPLLRALNELEIVPNYTTNAMHFTDKLMEETVKYCGGVAISLYNWTEKFWRKGLDMTKEAKIRTNVHLVISDRESIDQFYKYYYEIGDKTEYFVLLAYMNVGFGGGKNSKMIDYDYLHQTLMKLPTISNVAFSSNFYEFLIQHPEYKVSMYEPESMSKYIIFDDSREDLLPSVYNNSFQRLPVQFSPENGIVPGVNSSIPKLFTTVNKGVAVQT